MPQPRDSRPVKILLVEDDPDDADLMRDALSGGRIRKCVHWVEDGEEAIQYLRGKGDGSPPRSRPDLILLDLHLPRKNGHEVLQEIKQDPDLRCIPIVILTSAENERAYRLAYDLHANCCVRKPMDQEEYAGAVQKIEWFWIHIASRFH